MLCHPVVIPHERGSGSFRTPSGTLVCIALLFWMIFFSPVSAAEITIDPGQSIADAINAAAPDDTIILNPGTYPENNIAISKNIIVRANTSYGGNAANTIIDATLADRVFISEFGNSLTLAGLTIRDGYTPDEGGAVMTTTGALTVNATRFVNCSAGSNGGAISSSGATVTIDSSEFSHCSGDGGGAIFSSGDLIVSSSVFTSCSATNGGAVDNTGSSTITSSTFSQCSATNAGGGLYYLSTPGSIHFSRFSGNTATFGGYDIYSEFTTVDAQDNWWGTNSDPSGQTGGSVNVVPWLILGGTATPSLILDGSTSSVKANLTFNSTDGDTSTIGHVPDGIPVTFGVTDGTGSILPAEGNLTMGMNRTTFTSAGTGTSIITATVDGVEVPVPVRVTGAMPLPVPDFTATPRSGPAPLEVTFTDLSQADPIAWNWSFGDGSFSTLRNPVHTYVSTGNFTVSLNVTNASGSDGIVRTDYIQAEKLTLITAFTANTTSGLVPLTVRFTDLSTGSPTGWAWFFGDETYTQGWQRMNASAGWPARMDQSAVAMPDGSIVLMGGNDGSTKNDVWRSTDAGTTWTLVNASPGWSVRSYHSAVAMPDGSIILTGGNGGSKKNDVWRSTDAGTTWTLVNASAGWSARYGHSTVAMPDGSIVLMGGYDDDMKNDVWRSTDAGTTWTLINASAGWSGGSYFPAVAMPDGSIVLMGGYRGDRLNDVWRSTDSGTTWALVNASAGWSGRYSHSAVAMPDGSIILMGGTDTPDSRTNDVWRSTDAGSTWALINASAGWSARHGHSAVAMPDGSIVLMGGYGGGMMNDVWRMNPAGSSVQDPVHTYTSTGKYTVALQNSNTGNRNATVKSGYVTAWEGVVANFTANVTTARPQAPIAFSDASLGAITHWNWSFGDGTYSEDRDPVHRYAYGDTFTVSLNVSGAYVNHTRTNNGYITIEPRSTDPIRLIGPNGSVYIGETWLNITESMGANTTLAWFNPGDDESATVPVQTLDVSDMERAYTIEPLNFTAYPGAWYSWSGGSTKGGAPVAFQVIDPSINFTITDVTTGQNVNGMVLVGDQLAFEINATIAPGTSAPGVPLRIVIHGPRGTTYTTLTDQSGTAHPLNISVVESPFSTGTIWNTENSLYEKGVYNITAIYDFNEMTTTNPVAGKTFALYQTVNISNSAPPPAPQPSFTSITPTQGTRNTTVPFVILGKDFVPGDTMVRLVNISGSNITAALASVTPTRIDGNITIPGRAVPGKWTLWITTGSNGNLVKVDIFTIANWSKPSVTSISPAGVWTRNNTVNYTITGTNFEPDNTVVTFWNASGTLLNATGSGVWLIEPTKIYGTVVVPYEAPSKTPYNVTVRTGDGGTGGKSAMFTVGDSVKPTVTAISPPGPWARNTTINYTITGTNFQPDNTEVTLWNASGTLLNASGSGVWLVTPTRIYGTVVIPYEAPSKTAYNVTVRTYYGGTGGKSAAFTIGNAAEPFVTAISPFIWARNTTVNYTISGSNFEPDNTEVALWNTSGTVLNATSGSGVWLVTPTKIYGTVVVPYEASSKTAYNITVFTYNGGSGGKSAAFIVGNIAKPTVTAISPPGPWARNTSINYTISGTNFQPYNTQVTLWNASGTLLNASGSGVWLVTPTTIYGTVVVPYEAPSKTPYNITVRTYYGGTGGKAAAFTIGSAAKPAVTAISPIGSWARNTTINYTITGTNFEPGNTVVTFWNASGTLLNASGSGVWLVEPTKIYGTVVVPFEAPSKTPYNVTVSTYTGGTGGKAAAFTIGNPVKPTVTAISPAGSWARNTTINYTITGTGFEPGNTGVTLWNASGTLLNASGSGVWLVTPTRIYGTVVVPYGTSSKTAFNITVSAYNGGTGGKSAAFMVGNAARPTVTAISPAGKWARNNTINYTITGTNFQPDNTEVIFCNFSGTLLNVTGSGVWLVTPTTIYGTVTVPFEAPSKTPYNITVRTYYGGTGGKNAAFTVGTYPPTVTSISPAGVWGRNTTVNYTITGTYFETDNTWVGLYNSSGTELNASGSGVWYVTPTTIYGTVVVPYEAPSKTPYSVGVFTYDGGIGTKSAAFTVGNVVRPTVTSISPAGPWTRNTTINYTITGKDFQPDNTQVTFWNASGTLLNASGSGVWYVEPTKIFGTVVVPFDAPSKTPYNITVWTYDGGTSGKNAAFTVTDPPKPTVTGISPAGPWTRNTTINYTISGTNFQPDNTDVTLWNASGTLLNASGSGVWLVTPTTIYGTVVVPFEAPSKTAYNITVHTYNGGIGGKTAAFTISNPAKPTVTAISPAGVWARNTTINYTITGTNFQPGNTDVTLWNASGTLLNASGSGVWLVTPTTIYGTVVVPFEAPSKTAYNITVHTYNGGIGGKTAAFTVADPAKPTVTAISPAGPWYRNETINYTITGTNFEPEKTTVTFWNSSGSELNASSGSGIRIVESTKIYGTVVVPFEASSKTSYNITVHTYNGGVGGKAAAFTITNNPRPTITAITPTRGYPNTTVAFTITGTNFQPDRTTIKLSHPVYGEMDTTTYSITPTQIIGGVWIPGNATLGAWKMNVTTLDGGRATVPFTVEKLPAPKIQSVYANSAGASVLYTSWGGSVSVNGLYLERGGRTRVTLSRAGSAEIEGSNCNMGSGTTDNWIWCSMQIPGSAQTGLWNVNVTTIDGGTTTYKNGVEIRWWNPNWPT